MLQIIVQSFVRAEVTIGIVLTILLISGRIDPQSIAFSLGGIGAFVLLQGMLPVLRRGPVPSQPTSKNERAQISDNVKAQTSEEEEARSSADRQPATSQSACSRKSLNRREYFIRAALMSLVIMGTACLIYWLSPPFV
ncbi:MAG: hypothetical protein V3T03_07525 [Candidatus Bipolaricaulota bacterium]